MGQWASPSTYIVTFTSGRAQDVQLSASNLQSAKVLQQAWLSSSAFSPYQMRSWQPAVSCGSSLWQGSVRWRKEKMMPKARM